MSSFFLRSVLFDLTYVKLALYMPDVKNCSYPNYEESCFTGSEAAYSTPGDSDIHSGDHRNLKFHTAQRSSQNSTESEK